MCHQDAIERVFMDGWQRLDTYRVGTGNRKFSITTIGTLLTNYTPEECANYLRNSGYASN